MSNRTVAIRMSIAEMADLAQQAERPRGEDGGGSWPMSDSFSVTPDAPVPFDGRELHTVLAAEGTHEGARNVLLVLYGPDGRDHHRMITFDPDTGAATGASGAAGPVSEMQAAQAAALTAALCRLLNSEAGVLRAEAPSSEQELLRNSSEPTLRWERHARAED